MSLLTCFHIQITSRLTDGQTDDTGYIVIKTAQEKVVTCFRACQTARHMTRVARKKKWNLGFAVILVHAFAAVAY